MEIGEPLLINVFNIYRLSVTESATSIIETTLSPPIRPPTRLAQPNNTNPQPDNTNTQAPPTNPSPNNTGDSCQGGSDYYWYYSTHYHGCNPISLLFQQPCC